MREPANDKNRVRQNKMHTQNSEMYSPKNKPTTTKNNMDWQKKQMLYICIYYEYRVKEMQKRNAIEMEAADISTRHG